MKLYNQLTRTVEEFSPLNPPEVTVYTCGPTVYDYPHIGNWFTFVRYDTLIRTLKTSNFSTKWVMNITDVGHLVSDADEGEDKLEKGARREDKTAWDVANFYGEYFVKGLARLHISTPTHLPKATDHIPEQIQLIQKLEEKGFTYIIDDGVYYDTSKFPAYGDFAQLDLDEQQAGKRVEYNPQKRNPTDFALWKFSPKDQQRDMEWDSPWGKGFPGWHLECSAMSMKYLGETLDIHSGGIDHIPIHHTNEIAQSEAVTGKPFAKYWLHTNHITVNDEKIAKSLGNGITFEDIEAKGFSLMDLRLHILESHYRSQSKFSWESLVAAHNRRQNLQALADLRFQLVNHEAAGFDFAAAWQKVLGPMLEDLDSPKALAALSEIEGQLNDRLIGKEEARDFTDFLSSLDELFGLGLLGSEDVTPAQRRLISDREAAREARDFTKADELRAQLDQEGLTVRDTPHGSIWARK